ncbi:type II toxin-antitoxin system VapC family toxin [Devosia ginsengisoli]|uniref:type II toxin-antitoxin system VapC family toxin n=1 Tax=Devosia ginsengisoli TaxID=400770 RepID=UPI0026E9A334|nr:type II toxin-antitoxin system VapC family toxin [Devosia ginsengisoli]MCR6673901.1 type II toxin-antitoxin system VapC family toxin [Devosia ginsengisoli]
MTTFVDTNVLIDALNPAAKNHEWAKQQLLAADRPLVVCDVVYSELSVGMGSIADTSAAIQSLSIERTRYSDAALFMAGKAFKQYRTRGGAKSNVLSDFLIGAAANDDGSPLLTANPKDFRSYFPQLTLICPP